MIRRRLIAAAPLLTAGLLATVTRAEGTPPDAPPQSADSKAAGGTPATTEVAGVMPAGEEPADPGPRPSDGFRVDLAAALWLPRVTGTVQDGAYQYDLAPDLGLTDNAASFAGELELSWGPWHVSIEGDQFSTDGTNASTGGNTFAGVTINAGDPTATSFSYWMAGVDLGADLYRPFADQPFALGKRKYNAANVNSEGGYKLDFVLGGFVGFRGVGVSQQVTNLRTGLSGSVDPDWGILLAGARVGADVWLKDVFPLLRSMKVDASAGFGPAWPGGGSFTAIQASITLYPCREFGIQMGYRLQALDMESGSYQIDSKVAGMFVGGVLHF